MVFLQYILASLGVSGIRGRQGGATMIEYALIIAVVSIALVFAVNATLKGSLDDLGGEVTKALGGTDPTAATE